MKKALHLISAKKAQESENNRLTLGDYFVDILHDKRHPGKIFHWIAQRRSSATVVYSGQEHTFEGAKAVAQSCLEKLVMKQKRTSKR